MATTPGKPPDQPPEFRAPPPSPVAGGTEAEEGDDELAGFLSRSFRVPELILPDRISHRAVWNLPEIDVISPEAGGSAVKLLRSAAASLGCFQLVNHGIPSELIAAAGAAAGGVFRMPPEKKKEASRSPERSWGFEVEDDEEDGETEGEEFFWWCGRRDEELAGIWPQGFKDFSDKMEQLREEILGRIASTIEQILLENDAHDDDSSPARRRGGAADSSVLCIHKHGRSSTGSDGPAGSLKLDVLQMLIRSSGCSHALDLHVCGGASRFHVYSKRGCVPFRLTEGAIVLTVGDQIQARSGGRYKHVIGKPVFHDSDHEDAISIAFLYSHAASGKVSSSSRTTHDGEKTITIARQVMIAACLLLLHHFILYIYANV